MALISPIAPPKQIVPTPRAPRMPVPSQREPAPRPAAPVVRTPRVPRVPTMGR